ncbi:MAG: hypothetical protein GY862_20340 [Gammaproteobacteria bacterium]|nr:hypothetical protein [Gammaproteobacteria bacterium]
MSVAAEMQFLMSGSGADGLGGVISAVRISGQSASAVTMSGISVVYASDNALGTGLLKFYKNGDVTADEPDGSLNPGTTDAIPAMTSSSAPGGAASAHNELSASYAAWKAMDDTNAYNRYWLGEGLPGWIEYQFATAKIINKYTVSAHVYPVWICGPVQFV